MKLRHPSVVVPLAFIMSPLLAMAGEPLSNCVELGNDQQIIRAGGGDQIFLRDGQSHYRLEFARNCDAVMMTSNIKINSDGQPNRLCPVGTRVRAGTSTCSVETIELISSEEFAKHRQRARR